MKLRSGRGLFWKIIKVATFSFIALMFIVITTTIASEDDNVIVQKAGGSYDGVNLVEVKYEPEATGPTGEGTTNGLNLLLIDKMNEGHLKDLLSLHRDNFEGKLGETKIKVPPNVTLGINANEYGKVKGTMIPITQIPFSNGEFVWKKPWKGIPAEHMTLEGMSHEEYVSVREVNDYNMIKESTFKGPFQMDPNYAHTNFLSNRNPKTSPNRTGQKGKWGYYPDSLYYITTRMARDIPGTMYIPIDEFNNAVASGELLSDVIGILATYIHNAGGGGAQTDIYTGVKRISPYSSEHYNYMTPSKIPKDVAIRVLNDYTKALVDGYSKSVDKEKVAGSSHPAARLLGTIYLLEAGWNLEQSGMTYIEKNCKSAYDYVGKAHFGKDAAYVEDFLKQKIKPLPVSDSVARSTYFWESSARIGGMADTGSPPKGWVYRYYDDIKVDVYDGKPQTNLVSGMQMEPLGQAFHAIVSGNYIYASILKMAGVDIDPTNPDDYMNKVTTANPGTWVPDAASTDWLRQAGVDSSKVSRGHMAVLNTLYRYTGSYYKWGGMSFPDKNCGHTINQICADKWTNKKGFDCADFVQMPMYDLTGDDWFKTTGGANVTGSMIALNGGADKRMYKIKEEDLQPGDIFVHQEHTGIFLKWDDSSKYSATILHTPGKNRKAGVAKGYPIKSKKFFNLTFLRFKYVDEINNNDAPILTPQVEWLDNKLHTCK